MNLESNLGNVHPEAGDLLASVSTYRDYLLGRVLPVEGHAIELFEALDEAVAGRLVTWGEIETILAVAEGRPH
jgi:hypothetical protein